MRAMGAERLILNRVIDTVHFAEKKSSSILQVADACAFFVKRRLMNTSEHMRFFGPLKPRMVVLPKQDI
jgi:hypothetical protein